MYRNTTTTVIGEVVVRSSENGDLELTFSKGPGVTLLTLRQDAKFAQVHFHLEALDVAQRRDQ